MAQQPSFATRTSTVRRARRSRCTYAVRRQQLLEASRRYMNKIRAASAGGSGAAKVIKKEESREDLAKAQPVTVVKTEPYNFVIPTEQLEDEQGHDLTSEVISLDERAADALFCTEDGSCDDKRVAEEEQSSESASGSRACGHISLRPGHHSPRLRAALMKKRHSAKVLQRKRDAKALKSSCHKVVCRSCQLHLRDKLKKAQEAAARRRSSSHRRAVQLSDTAYKSLLADETFVRCDSVLAKQQWDQEMKDGSCAATQLDLKAMPALPPFKVTSRFLKTYSRPRERQNGTKEAEDAPPQSSDHMDDRVGVDDGCKTDTTVRPQPDAVVSATVNSELVKTDSSPRECSLLVRESKTHKAEKLSSQMSGRTEAEQPKCDIHSVIKTTICQKGTGPVTFDRPQPTTSLPHDSNIPPRQTGLEVGASQKGTTFLLHSSSIRTAPERTNAATTSPETSSCPSVHGSLRENLRVLWNVGTQTNLQRFSKWTQTTSMCC